MWRTGTLTPTPNSHISGRKNASRLIAPALAVIAKPVPHPPLPASGPQPPLHLGPPPGKRPTASDARRAGCCRPRRKVVTASNQQHPLPSTAGWAGQNARGQGERQGTGAGSSGSQGK